MILLFILFASLFFLSIGSFLNVIAYRLVHPHTLFVKRSFCPHCRHFIAWYDLVPLISWFFLKGKCRRCKHRISPLYPFIELITLICFWLLIFRQPSQYWFAYGLCIAALIVTIRTDLETFLISRLVTLFLIPAIWLFIGLNLLPITLIESLQGILVGGGFLWLIGWLFYQITGKQGLGQGDIDLLAFIGSSLGPLKCWLALLIGSVAGSLLGIAILLIYRNSWNRVIPFGPFLAFGALYTIFSL